MILNWTLTASKIYQELTQSISKLENKPILWAILVWDSSASLRYIKQKRKFAEQIWMWFELIQLSTQTTENELLDEIKKCNSRKEISGYIVQLPLPEHINTHKIISSISPNKDVDGFHPENQWKLMIWDSTGLSPCTPKWVMKLFQEYNISLSGKKVVVLGQSNIAWKPMAQMCINAWATVTSCNHLTPDISLFTKTADVIISATGVVWLITPEIVWKNCVIIDVGFSVVDGKIKWDADTQALIDYWTSITPVPGWVGPMTVAMLMENTYLAHMKKYEKQ